MINIGIIGYGYMGKIRETSLTTNKSCKLKSIFHTEPLDSHPAYTEHWETILEDSDIDAVFLCVPNFIIADMVSRFLEAGKHVFCEKPPGMSIADVKHMQAAEAKSQKVLKFGFNHRYHPAILEAKQLIEKIDFGKMLWMRGCYGKDIDSHFGQGWRAEKEKSGGGIFLDQGIHMLDLFLHFAGNFNRAKGLATNAFWEGNVEDNLFTILENSDGVSASLHSTMSQWKPKFSLEISFAQGWLAIEGLLSKTGRYGPETLSWSLRNTPPTDANYPQENKVIFHNDSSWDAELDEFINAIQGTAAVTNGNSNDAEKLMGVVEMIYNDCLK